MRKTRVTLLANGRFAGPGDARFTIAQGLFAYACELPFQKGERYLVSAFRTKDSAWETNPCTGTPKAADAAEDLI